MKSIVILCVTFLLIYKSNAQQVIPKTEYSIKYEVLTKPDEKIIVNYFDKDEKNVQATASESWVYTFKTTNKDQNIQVSTVGGQQARKMKNAKVWVKINIYVDGNLIKTKEEKVLGLGPSVQVNLNDIK